VTRGGDAADQRLPPWPAALWLVRHGESAGNVARDRAEAARLPLIELAEREMDVPLSRRGREQAEVLGRWFARLPIEKRPNVMLCSPYVRATETMDLLVRMADLHIPGLRTVLDERLREKEFGDLDRLTKAGIAAGFPEQALLRAPLRKFYYRPPNGESWCDVLLRVRGVLDQIQLQYRGDRVLIVGHQVIVLCFRYLLESMTERQILDVDAAGDVANCSVTSYYPRIDDAGRVEMTLELWNYVAPLEEAGAPVTAKSDGPAGLR
jgi:probable phosphoglycerate mutase